MASIFGNVIKDNTDINDEVLANNIITSASASAQAYLNAVTTSTTPELKAMYTSSLNQILGGHAAVTELAVKKGWEKPYNSPGEQLSDAYTKSKTTLE